MSLGWPREIFEKLVKYTVVLVIQDAGAMGFMASLGKSVSGGKF
jgi:hypothetical protein